MIIMGTPLAYCSYTTSHKLKASQNMHPSTGVLHAGDSLDIFVANHAFEAQSLGLSRISNISGYLGYLNQDLNTHSRWKSIIGHWKETLNAGSGMILLTQ